MEHKIGKVADRMRELIPVMVFCIAIVVIVCISLKVISYGYLPPDDAMRHAAKVISGKSWDQILVMRPHSFMFGHIGWDAILGAVHKLAGCDQDGLVAFSVVSLFLLFCLLPLFFADYHEAWLASLLVIAVTSPGFMMRLLLGRPYIVTMAILLVIFFFWPRLKEKKPPLAVMVALTVLIALSAWIHGVWYLFALPAFSFFAAREYRAGTRFLVCAGLGALIGASLTGHPCLFMKQAITETAGAVFSASTQRLLVGELQSFGGDVLMIFLILVMLGWRKMRGKWDIRAVYNPIFILAAMGWVLGFIAARFWWDWGMPAVIFWLLSELNEAISEKIKFLSWSRVFLTLVLSAALFLAVTADSGSRWTYNLTTEYLEQGRPEYAEWLPEPGGIIYSDDMGLFYQTFFKNPKAPWRYILGFESSLMPPEDLIVLRKIHWNFEADKAFEPWVKKMRPQDRLIIRRNFYAKPNISSLEWYYAATGTWIGRLPRH